MHICVYVYTCNIEMEQVEPENGEYRISQFTSVGIPLFPSWYLRRITGPAELASRYCCTEYCSMQKNVKYLGI